MARLQSPSAAFSPTMQSGRLSHLQSPCQVGVSIILIVLTGKRGSERCSDLPEVTQPHGAQKCLAQVCAHHCLPQARWKDVKDTPGSAPASPIPPSRAAETTAGVRVRLLMAAWIFATVFSHRCRPCSCSDKPLVTRSQAKLSAGLRGFRSAFGLWENVPTPPPATRGPLRSAIQLAALLSSSSRPLPTDHAPARRAGVPPALAHSAC